ncbi:cupin domain-containing protein [Wenxinia marina]|uniref:Uncharacterized protein n=1 Tax=Wenxinia marina DSM 24838 TaxID=1123501 RepID=A0A0D0PGI7_9RHOB|nr:cupin domain-containing protein [Wenxinia marina]KIQ70466.1 Uncharacterized protein Wenmar_00842 [Wenxinia marina DSM 24838]GGL52889.1 hypothetical protein GCM10011392_04110 [Wenxinia marina]
MADVRPLHVPPNGGVPNHPRWPALILPGVAPADIGADGARALVRRNGWGGDWLYTVFDYHHFHPDAHEALLCVAGRATLRLGGPEGETLEIGPGDGLILPAGFGHKRERGSADFAVVGAYPPGQESPRILRAGDEFEEDLAALPAPERDPFDTRPFPAEWA